MDRPTRARKRCRAVALIAAAFAVLALSAPVPARVLEIGIDRTSTAIGRIDGLTMRVDWPDDALAGALILTADALDASELGYRYRNLRWQCLLLHPAPDRFTCEGKLRARGQGSATLKAEWSAGVLDLRLGSGRGEFAVNLPSTRDAPIVLKALRLPAPWLQPLLAPRWKEGRFTTGTMDATLEVRSVDDGTKIAGPIAFADLGVDSSDGRIAAATLDASGRVAMSLLPDAAVIDVDLNLNGGELLVGPLYANLPDSPVAFGATLRSAPDASWSIERFDWNDPGVFELSGTGSIDATSEAWLRAFDAKLTMSALRLAHARYLDTLLGTLGLSKLEIDGALRADFSLRNGRPTEVDLDASAVAVRDGAQRFALQGVDGGLHWTSSDVPVSSDLRWNSAQIYDVALGAATLPLQSAQRGLSLRAPVSLAMLGGTLALSRFAWRPASESQRSNALDLAMTLDQLDLARLSKALGWPEFPGTLSGRIPGVRYADDVLNLEGGLGVDVFDGKVDIAEMTLERPFGVAPTMTAKIAFTGLDLKPLTGTFGFGEITGRLDGYVRDLRLLDWSPVAFDADLHTSANAKGPRRISQRAVNDLSRVGGAGLVAGLQNQVLKLFDTFGYARIGLRCRLRNNVCQMDGVDSSGGGYTIVEGSGLPRITVIGHQRQVDWPVLVARLKAATDGQTPIIE